MASLPRPVSDLTVSAPMGLTVTSATEMERHAWEAVDEELRMYEKEGPASAECMQGSKVLHYWEVCFSPSHP